MKIDYPKYHQEIVKDLMDGKFILYPGKLYKIIVEAEENDSFYTDYFKTSFDYDLIIEQDYIYLISKETDENTSRDIMIFFSILSFEIDKSGTNFIDGLKYTVFDIDMINNYFENSSWSEIIKSNKQLNNSDNRKKLIKLMIKRNIIEKENNDKFQFTNAYKVFTEFARELINKKKDKETNNLDIQTDNNEKD